jgi:hypothetical protein
MLMVRKEKVKKEV